MFEASQLSLGKCSQGTMRSCSVTITTVSGAVSKVQLL